MSDKPSAFRNALRGGSIVRVAGVHDGLTALMAERCGFDALWASGLGISAVNGVPDASILTMTETRDAAAVIDRASTLPVVADCDTGFGEVRNVRRTVADFEHAGIAAICIEDKQYPKRNSFLEGQELADPHEFAARVSAAKEAQTDPGFVVIARLESLIAGAGMEDALARALLYDDAGADAIVVHSKAASPIQVLEFAKAWRERRRRTPLVAIPTTYNSVTAAELEAAGFAAVIYANQALRATVDAAERTLRQIVADGTSAGVEDDIAPLSTLFELTGEAEVGRDDERYADAVARSREPSAGRTKRRRRTSAR